jgi:hypothetical protein
VYVCDEKRRGKKALGWDARINEEIEIVKQSQAIESEERSIKGSRMEIE